MRTVFTLLVAGSWFPALLLAGSPELEIQRWLSGSRTEKVLLQCPESFLGQLGGACELLRRRTGFSLERKPVAVREALSLFSSFFENTTQASRKGRRRSVAHEVSALSDGQPAKSRRFQWKVRWGEDRREGTAHKAQSDAEIQRQLKEILRLEASLWQTAED